MRRDRTESSRAMRAKCSEVGDEDPLEARGVAGDGELRHCQAAASRQTPTPAPRDVTVMAVGLYAHPLPATRLLLSKPVRRCISLLPSPNAARRASVRGAAAACPPPAAPPLRVVKQSGRRYAAISRRCKSLMRIPGLLQSPQPRICRFVRICASLVPPNGPVGANPCEPSAFVFSNDCVIQSASSRANPKLTNCGQCGTSQSLQRRTRTGKFCFCPAGATSNGARSTAAATAAEAPSPPPRAAPSSSRSPSTQAGWVAPRVCAPPSSATQPTSCALPTLGPLRGAG